MTIANEFAAHCADLAYGDVPADVESHAKKFLLDALGDAIGGYERMGSGDTFADIEQ